jgi:hypothetical protein
MASPSREHSADKHLKWSDVRHFELTNAIYGPRLRIDLTDGDDLPVHGFMTRSKWQRKPAQARVAEMNRRAEAGRKVDLR